MFARFFNGLCAAALALQVAACTRPSPRESGGLQQPPGTNDRETVEAIRKAAHPLTGAGTDHDPLVARAATADRILLGESTHGTHEYYADRGRLTLRLIREAGVNAIAIEGDWSPTRRVDLYVRGLGRDRTAEQALRGYARFPHWMWPNRTFRDFLEQLRAYNLTQPSEQRVGVYGMDVYDLYDAVDAVQDYLRRASPAAFQAARSSYRCFSAYNRNNHSYGVAAADPKRSCREEAASVVARVRALPVPSGADARDEHFGAVRAAESVAAAETYFRTTYTGGNSWNERDRSMARTVEELAQHVQQRSGRPGKVVTWSHNTHTGDARATSAAQNGELNLGQLMKQQHGDRALLVGYFSNSGSVFAAPEWDQPGRVYRMRDALPGSYSHLFNQTGLPAFLLLLNRGSDVAKQLTSTRIQRAIGVVYVPNRERQAHYFDASLSQQFDAVIFYDRTSAVQPL
jgi:erythromycin esterase-like protein